VGTDHSRGTVSASEPKCKSGVGETRMPSLGDIFVAEQKVSVNPHLGRLENWCCDMPCPQPSTRLAPCTPFAHSVDHTTSDSNTGKSGAAVVCKISLGLFGAGFMGERRLREPSSRPAFHLTPNFSLATLAQQAGVLARDILSAHRNKGGQQGHREAVMRNDQRRPTQA
jgi:hypothetical protein